MKKILLITDFFRPEPGGIEGFFTELARSWRADRIRVCVTAPESFGITSPMDRLRFDASEEFPVDRIAAGDELSYRRKMRNFDSAFAMILDRFNPDHVIVGNLSRNNLRVLRRIVASGIPYSFFVANGGDLKKLGGSAAFLHRSVIRRVANVFTLSRFFAARVAAKGISRDRIAVLPPAAERRSSGKREELPEKIVKLINKNKIIVGVGPLMPWKGFEHAIEALSILKERTRRVHLVIAGSGPEYAYLAELIRLRSVEKYVTLAGLLSDGQMRALLSVADLLVQPNGHPESRDQGLSSAIIEAIRHGIPAVIGEGGAADELIEDGISGFLVDGRDAAMIAERISRLCSDDKLRHAMSRNTKKKFREGFDIANTIDALSARIEGRAAR